ncbi:hypothetical protein BDV97DRAFT_369191 [Delphinella strobiligena]|nr:hypothetical protein BDV97DRAFT_369191 [Delphinella strobiligena]
MCASTSMFVTLGDDNTDKRESQDDQAQTDIETFSGVMVLTCFHMGALAQSILELSSAPEGYGYGSSTSIPWSYWYNCSTGVGSMLGIYISGDSGAYLNPAITLAN